MGLVSTLLGVLGFGIGTSIGLLVGYFFYIYFQPSEVKDPIVRSLHELDSEALHSLIPEIPYWMKNPDYERVDWLNKFILDMWPCLDKAICNTIHSTVKPIFDQYIGKYWIESIVFDQLTLGSLPPTIHGVKVYETQEKELVVEPAMRWAGNTNVVLMLKLSFFKVTIQLLDLQISLVPRVTLKPLVPSFPCFANLSVSLMEKPNVDFGLKIFGGDIMAIPGLYRFIQDTIATQVSNIYHWPNLIEIPILEGSSTAVKKPVGILNVNVVRAYNLLKMDILGKSDPYVKLSLSGEGRPLKKTSIKMRNLNPEWNEQFKLIVKDPETQVLQLHVYDWDKVKMHHDKLGMQCIPLNMIVPHETKEFTLDLQKNMNPNDPQNQRNRGKIVVQLTFDPFKEDTGSFNKILDEKLSGIDRGIQDVSDNGGLLLVTIEAAEDIEGKHHTNPYVVVLFRGEKKKTKVTWDEPDLLLNVNRVNPWLVELVSNISSIHLAPFSPPRKKLRIPQHPDFTLESQLPTPVFPGNSVAYSTNPLCYFPDSTPAGIQGARHAQFGISLSDLHLNKLQAGLFHAGFRHLDRTTSLPRISTGFLVDTPVTDNNISCLLTIGSNTKSTKSSLNSKPPQLVLFGKPILTEEQISLSNSGENVSPGATINSSGCNMKKTINTSDSDGCANIKNVAPVISSYGGFQWCRDRHVSELGLETGHCKVFIESDDVGRTLDLSMFGSYEELYGRLADMFGIEKSEMMSHVIYKDAAGVVKRTGDEPFSDFMKAARRLTILTDSGSNNIGRLVVPGPLNANVQCCS